jgi:hypothetical protein
MMHRQTTGVRTVQEREANVLSVAAMIADANAAGDAALRQDFDEARFRTHCLKARAIALGFNSVAAAAASLTTRLGPVGAAPSLGYGASMLAVADELDLINLSRPSDM